MTRVGTDSRNSRSEAARATGQAGAAQQAVEDTFADPKLRDARAYVIPAEQLDPAAVRRFVGILIKGGVEVHRLTAAATIGRRKYSQRTFVFGFVIYKH